MGCHECQGLMPRLMPITTHFFFTLDVNTTHFNELSPFSIFETYHILSLPLLRYEFSSRWNKLEKILLSALRHIKISPTSRFTR
jgi:hypothetical protein